MQTRTVTCLLGLAALTSARPVDLNKLRVEVEHGTVVGNLVAPNVGAWLGIPYAAPPTGQRRWQPPVDPEHWEEPHIASHFGHDCPQAVDKQSGYIRRFQSEDCLYLNVWAPLNKPSHKADLPVFVFIHGGSFTAGSGSGNDWPVHPLYQGGWVAREQHGAVLVTFNYRLGAMGWLGGDAVAAQTPDGSAGNFGLQDTEHALRWVRKHAHLFGGDRSRVLVFGESSGASMVSSLMVMPSAGPLFTSAAMESGSYDNATCQPNPNANFNQFAATAGCEQTTAPAQLACLRGKGLPGLRKAMDATDWNGIWGPAVDGVVLTNTPERLAAHKKFNKLSSVILGLNKNEGESMIPDAHANPWTEERYQKWLKNSGMYPKKAADAIFKLYPCIPGDELGCWRAAAQTYTDSQYTCPARRTARNLLTQHGANSSKPVPRVYMYFLEWAPEAYTNFLATYYGVDKDLIGVPHGGELPMVFNTSYWIHTGEGQKLTNDFMTYFHNMAATDNVNSPAMPKWKAFEEPTEAMLMVDEPLRTIDHFKTVQCNFWDTIVLPLFE
eukprot:Rhum_TRINITY_DN8696_c0_g1::Rhum_TRINITY_DN8696_c0_g1_i1::g.29396::m.29396/K03929/pnbA; para-nitrobenzyl esterase